LAGPDGTPVTPCVPAPAEPALGEPAALPLLLPVDDPPADPPVLCATEMAGNIRIAIAATMAVAEAIFIGNLLFGANDGAPAVVPAGTISAPNHSFTSARRPELVALAQIDRLRR
jgi:hypothetical protein